MSSTKKKSGGKLGIIVIIVLVIAAAVSSIFIFDFMEGDQSNEIASAPTNEIASETDLPETDQPGAEAANQTDDPEITNREK